MSNFKTALKEILTLKNSSNNKPDDDDILVSSNRITPFADKLETAINQTEKNTEKKSEATNMREMIPIRKTDNDSKPDSSMANQKNIITANTKVFGNIVTDANIDIFGVVEGDIDCKGNVLATGKVVGKITCDSAEIDSAFIEGDLDISETLFVKIDSKIIGTLNANSIQISGKVKGDIFAKSEVKIHREATIIGDITTPSISIESGASVQGKIDVQRKDNVTE